MDLYALGLSPLGTDCVALSLGVPFDQYSKPIGTCTPVTRTRQTQDNKEQSYLKVLAHFFFFFFFNSEMKLKNKLIVKY